LLSLVERFVFADSRDIANRLATGDSRVSLKFTNNHLYPMLIGCQLFVEWYGRKCATLRQFPITRQPVDDMEERDGQQTLTFVVSPHVKTYEQPALKKTANGQGFKKNQRPNFRCDTMQNISCSR
jgi:hypothetical protein